MATDPSSSQAAQPLSGKTCLVTGGAGGLGAEIAHAFLSAGANVVICDINAERVQQTVTSFSPSFADQLLGLAVDITDPAAIQALFAQAAARFGGDALHVLVNNAAVMDRFDPAADLDPALWDRVLAVNLTAPFLLSKLALQGMLAQGTPEGCIINIASGAARAGWLAGTAYTASKHGLVGLTKSTAAFYGAKGIRCNALLLGPMGETNMNDAFRDGIHPEGRQKLAGLMAGHPPALVDKREVAALCVSLASGPGWSSLVNGACIAVDHGWTTVLG